MCVCDLSGSGCGVALYVRDDLHSNLLYVDSTYNDFIVLELECGVEKVVIGVFYRSPNSSQATVEELYSLITFISSKFNCKKCLMEILIFPIQIGIQYQGPEVLAIPVISLLILFKKISEYSVFSQQLER